MRNILLLSLLTDNLNRYNLVIRKTDADSLLICSTCRIKVHVLLLQIERNVQIFITGSATQNALSMKYLHESE